jgi:alkyl sulfatase BDS1-like metallo-beta-lactamase superfamily hydrolase
MSLRSRFLAWRTNSSAQAGDGTGRRRFLMRSGVAAGSLALFGLFPLAWLRKDPAGFPPRARTADAASAGAGLRPEAATTTSRGAIAGVNPELRAHGAIFERKIHEVGDNVYSAVGWSGCNTIMVVGNDGVIIVDTGDGVQWAREVAAEFRTITDKPVRAIIYTCFHIDHMFGVKAFATADDVRDGRVEIIAHESLLANVWQSVRLGPILGVRTVYNFGATLGGAEIEGMNIGTAALPRSGGEATFLAPTRTFSDALDITIAGVAMQLVHVPSEASDEIAVFLPQSGILLSAEVIPAQTFPVLDTLRGERFRDPVDWYESIDRLRRLRASAMVPAHGLPVLGAENVEQVLRNYRDAIQYVHDQTVRHMNKGLTPDQLVEVIRLPPHLEKFKPWMSEFSGTVRQAVRGIYRGYLGWYEGDPVALAPLAPVERARREITLMGGRDRVMAAANQAFENGDAQWAAELATLLIRVDHDDMPARQLKAKAFRQLGYAEINAIWRCWYLSAARELDVEGFDPMTIQTAIVRSISSADQVASLPARIFVESFGTRLKAEDTLDVTMTVGFRFPDIGEAYGVAIRRGIAEFVDHLPEQTDLTLALDKTVLDRIRLGSLTMREAVLGGAVKWSGGSLIAIARFFGYFELPFSEPIRLAVR